MKKPIAIFLLLSAFIVSGYTATITNEYSIPDAAIETVVDDYLSTLNLGAYCDEYTPTLYLGTNASSPLTVPYTVTYCVTDDVVSMGGHFDIDPTLATPTTTVITMSLPVASDFTNLLDASGTFVSASGATNQLGGILADDVNDRIKMAYYASNVNPNTFSFTAMYKIK